MILLIAPSNLNHMPYVKSYIDILNRYKYRYKIINWDRFNNEKETLNNIIYKDKKIGHRRNFFDYYKFSRCVKKEIKKLNPSKIIIFGIQLSFFLKGTIVEKFHNNYIIDIRDYNKIFNKRYFKKIFRCSNVNVISSNGYKKWLSRENDGIKYVINHNFNMSKQMLNSMEKIEAIANNDRITISYIGSLSDKKVNDQLIDKLKNNSRYILRFIGEGIINNHLLDRINNEKINNMYVEGYYEKELESQKYKESELINMLMSKENINNLTCLSNRLYNAAYNSKPLIVLEGSYMAKIVERHSLGLVLDNLDNIEYKIERYLEDFDVVQYNNQRYLFMEKVIEENNYFETVVKKFFD